MRVGNYVHFISMLFFTVEKPEHLNQTKTCLFIALCPQIHPKSRADLEIKSLSILSVMQKARSIELTFTGYTESFNLDSHHEQHYLLA